MFKRINLYVVLFFVIAGFVIFVGCSEDETEVPVLDTTAPTVLASEPANSAVDVSRSGPYWVLFSETMNEESVEDSLLFEGTGTVSKNVGSYLIDYNTYWRGDSLFISPYSFLNGNIDYIITASGSSEDLSGNKLGDNYSITFTTTSDEDTDPPTVLYTIPLDGAEDVTPVITIEITFSESIQIPSWDWDTQTFFTLEPSPNDGDISVEGPTLLLENLVFPQDTTVEVTLVTRTITDLAGNTLAPSYTFSFDTATDNIRPTLVSATPSNGATGVSPTLSQIVFNFSEPMNPYFDMPPENIDARIEHAVPDDPTWNAEITSMTVPLVSSYIAPGCTYWVEFNAMDMAGNPIDPDPTPYQFTTSGTASYFPVADGNTWYFHKEGTTDLEISSIQNYNPSSGTFDITFQGYNGSTWETHDVWHMQKTHTEIKMLGHDEYDNGIFEENWTWDSSLTLFKLPIIDHLDETWPLSTTFTVGETTATLSGTITMAAGLTDIIVTGNELEGTFKSCVKHTLSITITAGVNVILSDQRWLAPGVGCIKEITEDSNSSGIDTLIVEGWEF
jgi:hypothetical protein